MTSHSVRVEGELRKAVEDVSETEGKSLLDTGQMLVRDGIKMKIEDEPVISGPFGVSRPFSKISFGGRKTEVRIRATDETVEEAKNIFNERNKTAALRQAMRLGVIANTDEEVKIEGPGGVVRPFADIE